MRDLQKDNNNRCVVWDIFVYIVVCLLNVLKYKISGDAQDYRQFIADLAWFRPNSDLRAVGIRYEQIFLLYFIYLFLFN